MRFRNLIERGREKKLESVEGLRPPIITTVYAACKSHEELLKECIGKTRENYKTRHLLAIDKASKDFIRWALDKDFEFIILTDRKSPRMKMLYRAALELIPDDLFFTIEQDVIFDAKVAETLVKIMLEMPEDVSNVGPDIVNARGHRTYPAKHMWQKAKSYGNRPELLDVWNNSFCATLWRREAFVKIDWKLQAEWPSTDSTSARYLSRLGYKHIACTSIKVTHFARSSKRPPGLKEEGTNVSRSRKEIAGNRADFKPES